MAGGAATLATVYWMGTRQQLEARQLHVTLRAVAGAADRTAVTMTVDLRPGVRRNVSVSQWIAGIAGGGMGLLTGAVLAKGAAVAASAAVLAPAVGVAAVVTGLSLLAYRRLYSSTVEKAEREMRRALEAVASAVKSEAVFGALAAPPRTIQR